MDTSKISTYGYHHLLDQDIFGPQKIKLISYEKHWDYTFENFFHPFVSELIERLNIQGVPGMLSPEFHKSLRKSFFNSLYSPQETDKIDIHSFPKEIDTRMGGPYANYNWELMFHVPLTIAVHLSKTQRFAEAQRWFHLIFDPTENDPDVPVPTRYWRFLAFREGEAQSIDTLLTLLSKPNDECTDAELAEKEAILNGYEAVRNTPFQPFAVARTRTISFMMHVVMKYLDNLIAWGDNLFQQFTREAIMEALQIYVLASNLLGDKPQRSPAGGTTTPRTFAQLRAQGLDPMGNALVELEGAFPFNFTTPTGAGTSDSAAPLFGMARTLYFCIPHNEKLLGYWDTVADRLFKIRNCMDIEGQVRPLALFDPPIDPGMLVKAAAAGLDIGSVVSGLNQPVSPVRSRVLIEKAAELAGEVRNIGSALLTALEKRDAEALALLRQGHEVSLQKLQVDLRYLQWKNTEAATQALIGSRGAALERLNYYKRLLGQEADPNAPETLELTRQTLTKANFDEAYEALVAQYDVPVQRLEFPDLERPGDGDGAQTSGQTGDGDLHLSKKENEELNILLPIARDTTLAKSVFHSISATLTPIPDPKLDLHYWGLGGTIDFKVGTVLSSVMRIAGDVSGMIADWNRDQAGMAARTAAYERRADEWILQHNLAAHDVMQIGRQILTSLIAEQAQHREYLNLKKAIRLTEQTRDFLRDKYTNEELYGWLQGELSKLYYEYYRFAFDTARRAEQTMKAELMRPELDQKTLVQFNYWDGGRKGLLSGEALLLDVKRMELAYHEHNRNEYELTKHVSLLQIDPLALVNLRRTGRCTFKIPEAQFDLDGPGHYFRRIKSVALSLPCVSGPYIGTHAKLVHLKSSIRQRPDIGDGYVRTGPEDDRFADIHSAESNVFSAAQMETGQFEGMPDDRYLPFENVGAVSEWRLELPADPTQGDPQQFDYDTISDVVLHLRYTARDGGGPVRNAAVDQLKADIAADGTVGNVRLFSLRHEFPTEWARFRRETPAAGGRHELRLTLRPEHYPYWSAGRLTTLKRCDLFAESSLDAAPATITVSDRSDTSDGGVVQDTLTRRPELGDLAVGQLATVPLPAGPTGEIVLFFDTAEFEDMLMTVTWGG